MTLAPRVQVYTQLSCNAIHQNYNHTNSHPSSLLHSLVFPPSNSSIRLHTTAYYEFDYNMPLPILLPEVPAAPSSLGRPLLDPTKACRSDPTVQSGAARLQTSVMVTMGILSALTTSFWGHFGERHGRTKVLGASCFGLFVT
jgi:MFS family permease